MKRLWLADVHANLPAFEAVLRAAGAADEVVYLGDIVGCGPHPAACVNLLQQLKPKAVLGNHDASVLAVSARPARHANPVDWDEWTFDQLNAAQRAYLAALPDALTLAFCGVRADVLHRLPDAPYLHPAMPDAVLAECLGAARQPVICCGHSHRAIDRTVAGCRLVCIPPVGQPRNGDPRAGYAIESDGHFACHFVAYAVERTVRDVQVISLDAGFCHRWTHFLRTAFDPEWSREYDSHGVLDRSVQATP